MYRSKTVAESEEKTFLKGETFPVVKAQNSQLQLDFYGASSDVPARTPPHNERVHSEKSALSHSICSKQSRLDGTQKDIGTEGAKVDDSVVNLSVLKYVKTAVRHLAAYQKFSTTTTFTKPTRNFFQVQIISISMTDTIA